MEHAKQMMKAGHTVVAFDTMNDWAKRSSIPKYVLVQEGMPFGNIPMNQSVIFDISMLTPIQQFEVVDVICQQIWQTQVKRKFSMTQEEWDKSKFFFLIFEEAQTYFPQGSFRSKKYQKMMRLFTGGRNFHIRMEVITQFASTVDKDAMKYMTQRYFGRTDEKNDVDYVNDILPEEYEDRTKTLKPGEFIYLSPSPPQVIQNPIFSTQTTPQKIAPSATHVKVEHGEPKTDGLGELALVLQAMAVLILIVTFVLALSM